MAVILNNPQVEKNFKINEFVCKCGCNSVKYNYLLVKKLQAVREVVGRINISSAYRCPKWNKQVGGATGSGHLQGDAADIKSDVNIYKLARQCYLAGFNRIGISDQKHTSGKYYLHVGLGTQPSYWVYDSNNKSIKITTQEFIKLINRKEAF